MGRAGGSFATALADAGWEVSTMPGRTDAVVGAADGVDLVLLTVPDGAVAEVAARVAPSAAAVVAHVAGSLAPSVLGPHPKVGAVHPLVSLPDAGVGAARLRGAWFAVAGDPLVHEVVAALGGRAFELADEHRTTYHAAAAIASNHLVALLGQVERVAAAAGVPFEAYLDLVRGTVENVAALGPAAALTGPAARGDTETIGGHLAALDAIDPSERLSYEALMHQAVRLAASRPRPE